MKVLLADDSLVDRMILETFLEDLGHEVIIGENGREAVELYRTHNPDLVIMDEIMPVMRGHEAARCIRDTEENWVPIIFLSAQFTADDIVAGIEAGADDYLAKPIDQKILAAKMKALQRIAEMRRKLLVISEQLEKANVELKKQADADGLTGLANRRFLDRFLHHEVSRCMRFKQSLGLLVVDIDFFKNYNDRYGHLKGDDTLKQVAAALSSACRRSTDLAARFGGEEFVMVLPGANLQEAKRVAEIASRHVKELDIIHEASEIAEQVTVSIGVTAGIPTRMDSPESFLKRADAALYQAKDQGRARIVGSDEIEINKTDNG